MNKPRLAEVQCLPVELKSGDRIIVRLKQSLDVKATKKLYETVQKWAGKDVLILIIDETIMDLQIESEV